MSLDHVLLWLSEKTQGSWSQFRGAVEQLYTDHYYGLNEPDDEQEHSTGRSSGLPIYHQVRFTLERLGHVEFSKKSNEAWRVVPPALAMLPSRPGRGLLCGARSPDLLAQLKNDDRLEITLTAAPKMPTRVLVCGSSKAIAHTAELSGVVVQEDAPRAILSSVPSVRDKTTWDKEPIPINPGWTVHRLSQSRLGWIKSSGVEALNTPLGLFRFEMGYQHIYFLRWGGRSYRVAVQVGKYAVRRKKRGILAYDKLGQTLSIPAMYRPPLLIERALILCSGLIPSYDRSSGYLEYTSVPPEVVRLAAQLLCQEVKQ